jgi:hypothetical protein
MSQVVVATAVSTHQAEATKLLLIKPGTDNGLKQTLLAVVPKCRALRSTPAMEGYSPGVT